jgi:antitoxin YefM
MQQILTVTAARSQLYKLVDRASESHREIYITGKHHDAVLVSAEDWYAIQETLYLQSIPKMTKSILKGGKLPLNKCLKKIKW